MKEKIIALRAQGKSYKEIQEELGCSKGTIAYHCGSGVKDKQIQRNRDKRSRNVKYVQEYKQSRGCVDCKENYPYWMLDLDHITDDKVRDVSKMTLETLDRIKEELAKCEVVCANCHRIRTYSRITKSANSTMSIDELYI